MAAPRRTDDRYASKNPVQVVSLEPMEFQIDTPTGKTTVTYGDKYGYNTGQIDRFACTFRGQRLEADRLTGPKKDKGIHRDSLADQIAAVEAEFQAKKRVDQARKEAAKDPLPACYLSSRYPATLVDVGVRGIDQRNGNALVVMPDGSKASVPAKALLRDLTPDERVDIENAFAGARKVYDEAQAMIGPSLTEVLADVQIDLHVRVDMNTFERVAGHGGDEYRGDSEDEVLVAVYRRLLTDRGWVMVDDTPVAEATRFPSYGHFYRTVEEQQAQRARSEEADRLEKEAAAFTAEYRFDLTQFSALTEPEPEQDEPETVPAVMAPVGASADWDD